MAVISDKDVKCRSCSLDNTMFLFSKQIFLNCGDKVLNIYKRLDFIEDDQDFDLKRQSECLIDYYRKVKNAFYIVRCVNLFSIRCPDERWWGNE